MLQKNIVGTQVRRHDAYRIASLRGALLRNLEDLLEVFGGFF